MAGTDPFELVVSPELESVVRPAVRAFDGLVVREGDSALDVPLATAAARMREAAEVTAAVRQMYRRVGLDPTRTRPSSEALLRRVRKGLGLPHVNALVDVINWCSLETQLPFGLYDRAAIVGAVTLRLGAEGEAYPGIRKDTVHVAGRLTLADELGPFGNPTSDSARTMVTPATTTALVVIFAPAAVPDASVARAVSLTCERVDAFCRA